MYQTATITSKRQLTIPINIYQRLGFKEGQKVLVSIDNDALRVESALDVVERLAGSLPLPEKYKNTSQDDLVKAAKLEYFAKKQTQNP